MMEMVYPKTHIIWVLCPFTQYAIKYYCGKLTGVHTKNAHKPMHGLKTNWEEMNGLIIKKKII